jgi:tetratricopeptide (TPR) repeat protein
MPDMKNLITYLVLLISFFSFGQEKEKEKELALKKANDFVHEANQLINKDNFVSAEMEYRKAISEQPASVAGVYNLGNSYYRKGNFEEALYRQQQAAKNAISKVEKHKAFHNIGNILMQNKQCKEAVEAFKSALRNDPTDDETRYNLVIAKECAEQQQDENKDDKDKDEDKKDQDKKEDQDQKDQDKKEDQKDQKDQNKDQGDQKKDEEGKPKEDQNKQDQQQQPRQQQLSPQQIKNLLEAMNNQEQKTQEKMNAEKQKGIPVKTAKDW